MHGRGAVSFYDKAFVPRTTITFSEQVYRAPPRVQAYAAKGTRNTEFFGLFSTRSEGICYKESIYCILHFGGNFAFQKRRETRLLGIQGG